MEHFRGAPPLAYRPHLPDRQRLCAPVELPTDPTYGWPPFGRDGPDWPPVTIRPAKPDPLELGIPGVRRRRYNHRMTSSREQTDDAGDFTLDPEVRRRRLWEYFRPYLKFFAAGALFLVLTNLMTFAIPEYLGDAIQMLRDTAGEEDLDLTAIRSDVIDAAIFIIILAIGAGIARVFSRISIFNACRFIEFDVRNRLYEHLSKLSPAFYNTIPTGDLTSRTTNDVTYVRLLYAIPFLHIVNTLIAYSIAIYRMAGVDWRLTLACLAPYPFLLYGIRKVIHALFLQTKVVQSQLSDLSTHIQENLSGIDVVKSYVLEQRESDVYGRENETYFDENLKLAKIRALLNALVVLIASTGTLVVLVVGSRFVIDGSMTLGAFVEFNGYIVALVMPTIALGWVFAIWHRGLAAFDRISELLEHTPELDEPENPRPLPSADADHDVGEIILDDVSFTYEDDEGLDQALDGISMTIPAGSTCAIVGKTGSGKTTLVKLIARLYDPDSGRILVDGVPVDRTDLRTLRGEIGFVPQEPFLFSMTVGQNVRFGLDSLVHDTTLAKVAPDTSLLGDGTDGSITQQERIEEAVDIAALRGDIEGFNEGLETLVGERGVTLSGGQKQRLTIARALLVDPRILILDDALASVDTHTERRILGQLKQIMAGRTSLLLTHRFNVLSEVDRIFVLDDGRLVEQGTHDELLDENGLYAAMYQRQQLEDQLDS